MTDPAASLRAAHDAVTRLVNLYFDRVPVEELDRELLAETIHEGLSDEWDRLYRIEAAVVEAPADRASVLRQAADALDESEVLRDLTDDHMHDVHAAANELRRMADETQLAEHQPPRHRWAATFRDPVADEWIPGTRFLNRQHAVQRYEAAIEQAPAWKDGTPVEHRLVRETTTYTVEAEHAPATGARQDREAATYENITQQMREVTRHLKEDVQPQVQKWRDLLAGQREQAHAEGEHCFCGPDCAAGARQDGPGTDGCETGDMRTCTGACPVHGELPEQQRPRKARQDGTFGPWVVQKICCGHDDGTAEFPAWDEADQFRETYVDSSRIAGHERSAIVRSAAGARQDGAQDRG